MPDQFRYASNALRLTAKQWAFAGAALGLMLFVFPSFWFHFETFTPAANYRLRYDFSDDYWFYSQWVRKAAAAHPIMVLGDSVVWGEYVDMENTLPEYLNQLVGGRRFANLGANGLHPAALWGVMQHYGGAIRDKGVLLTLNFLWLSSPKHDLRWVPKKDEEDDFRFNHPELVPQFYPAIPLYKATFEERAGNVVKRTVPFVAWVAHLRAKSEYYALIEPEPEEPLDEEGAEEPEPEIDDPHPKPFRAFLKPVPPPENQPHSNPVTWKQRGIPVTDFKWPTAAESFQWSCFKEVIAVLRARNNKVYVFISPFNPYIMTAESQAQYAAMVNEVEHWLVADGVKYLRGTPPPSEEYADASHPLAAGYARLAKELYDNKTFQKWLSETTAVRLLALKKNTTGETTKGCTKKRPAST